MAHAGVVVQLSSRAPELPDEALVEQALAGSRRAFAMLYKQHARMAFGLAHRLLAGHDVDDAVQDAFVTAWERLDTLTDPQAFGRWLGTIVINVARRRIRRRRLRDRLLPGSRGAADPDAFVGACSSPEDAAELAQVYRHLHRLDADCRVALVLRRVEGMTIAEVAEAMELSVATVKRRLAIARRQLGVEAGVAS